MFLFSSQAQRLNPGRELRTVQYFNERGKIGAYQQTLALMKQLQQILAQSNRSDFS
jgi:hypothetical protein